MIAIRVCFAVLLIGCTATNAEAPPTATISLSSPLTVTVGPTPVASTTSAPSPEGLRAIVATLADGTLTISFPDCHRRLVDAYQRECDVFPLAADRDVAVMSVQRYVNGTMTFETRAVDLKTAATIVVRGPNARALGVDAIRDDIAVMTEYTDAGVGKQHVRLLRGPWRDPTRVEVIDEYDLEGLGGGDTWNPWPYVKTNGKDIVWLRPLVSGGYGIALLRGSNARETIAHISGPVWFDLDDAGRVAIAASGTSTGAATQQLELYDGALKVLGTRAAEQGGYVMSFGDQVGWAHGYGSVMPARDIEIISLRGSSTRVVSAPPGCSIGSSTYKDIAFVCDAVAQLFDVQTSVARIIPGRVVSVFKRIVLWRDQQDLGADTAVWRATLP